MISMHIENYCILDHTEKNEIYWEFDTMKLWYHPESETMLNKSETVLLLYIDICILQFPATKCCLLNVLN